MFSSYGQWQPLWFLSKFKGVEKGDPLSPYLFILVIEVFSILTNKDMMGGLLSGFRAKGRGREEMLVMHMLFADDTLVFCGIPLTNGLFEMDFNFV